MTAVLELRNATKTFPGVRALDDVSLHVNANEVVGLIGENGAGKSTLLKALTGVYDLDQGEIFVNGQAVNLRGPRDAFDHGVAMVFQEQSVLATLNVAENIFLGREAEFTRGGVLRKRQMRAAARQELDKVHLDVDPATSCADLTFAQRQMVEIAKALSLDSRIEGDIVVLLDEPTSVLEAKEIELLFDIVRGLRDRAAFVFISHRLDEVLSISDRVYVMRDGAVVGEMAREDASIHDMHSLMVGRALHHEYYREQRQGDPADEVALSVKGLAADGFRDVSFDLHRGEILGIAGVVGSGREALARALGGLDRITAGEMQVHGARVGLSGPADAVRVGIGYVPRERKIEGIVAGAPVAENMTLASLGDFVHGGLISKQRERQVANAWIDKLQIKTPSTETMVGSLSGGNQQKMVLAKWRIAGSDVLILDHPTRGIDVGAKEDVYELIRDMTEQGLSIVLLGDTLEELIGLSHRILVMRDGEVTATFDAAVGAKPEQVDLITHMV